MTLLQGIWTLSILLAIWALLSVFSLIIVRVFRERRLSRQAAICASLRADLITHIAMKSEDPLAEAALDRPGFITVALDLLMQIDGESRRRLVDLMHRRKIDDRLRHGLRHLNQSKRVTAAEALSYFPSHETRNVLLRALRDRDLDVRLAAAASLVNLNVAPPLAELLPALARKGHGIPVRLGQILRDYCELDPDAVIATVRQRSLHPFIRAKAVETLAATGDSRHISAIQSLVLAPEPDLRAAALRALARLPDAKSRDAIALCLRDKSWFVRAAAADTAGRLGLYDLVPLIAPLVDDEQWWVRFRASEALENLDAAGRSALRKMARQGTDRQRRQATLTLTKRVVA
jgi:HEAT repeat protein